MDSRHLEQEEPDIQDMAAMLQELRRLAVAVKFEEGRVHRKARRMLVVVGQRHPNQDRQPVHCGLHNTGMSICPQKKVRICRSFSTYPGGGGAPYPYGCGG